MDSWLLNWPKTKSREGEWMSFGGADQVPLLSKRATIRSAFVARLGRGGTDGVRRLIGSAIRFT